MRPDEDRDANGVVPLPMCLAHRHTRGGGYPGRATNLDSRLRGNDALRSDQNRDGSPVARLPMCGMAHRHTRGGGYPEDGISLEIVYLRA